MIKYNKKQIYNILKNITIAILVILVLNIIYKYIFSYKESFFPYDTLTCNDNDNEYTHEVRSGYIEDDSDCTSDKNHICVEINPGISGLFDRENMLSNLKSNTCSDISYKLSDYTQAAADDCDK